MPNIRLANGLVKQETRQRLDAPPFNTPFFPPEVLVASSVLAEGVDLHRKLPLRHSSRFELEPEHTGAADRSGGPDWGEG